MDRDLLNEIGGEILDAAMQVHKNMKPGLLESVYQAYLAEEFNSRNIMIQEDILISSIYKGKQLHKTFKIDILVENQIILGLKAIEALLLVHEAQIISYLKLANKKLEYLINFTPLIEKRI